MHGYIHYQFKLFIIDNFGRDLWNQILKNSFDRTPTFLASNVYDDEDLFKLVKATVDLTNIPLEDALFKFGCFLAQPLIKGYRALLKPDWGTLDIVEHTEDVVHKVVRIKLPGAEPPRLNAIRLAEDKVLMKYDSKRKLCPVLKGIATGIAQLNEDTLDITDKKCMYRGDGNCEVIFELSN